MQCVNNLQTIIYNFQKSIKMVDNISIQYDTKKLKQQHDIKKLLPSGACSVQQYKKYEYIRNFMKDKFVYRYVLPINHIYAPFVVIKRMVQSQKYPIYQLYYHPTNSFILSAQQQNMNIGCNYLISSKEKPCKNQFFIAKLRGNFNRNQFHLYDNGSNPDKSKNNPRKQLSYIKVQESSIWNKNQKLTMYVPRAYESNRSISQIHKYQPIEFLCQSNNSNPILQDYKEKYNTVQSLQLKQVKSPKNKVASLDSLILESTVRTQSVLARKKSQTYYQLQIGSPLTIVQGFGFLLTLIQANLI